MNMNNRKSSDNKLLEGNPGQRAIEEKKLKAEDKKLKCPSWINSEAKKKFKNLEKQLREYGLILNIDIDILTAYCHYYTRWRKVEMLLEKQLEEEIEKILQLGQRGITENPLIRISDRYCRKWIYFGKNMGLSLADRYRVGIEPEIKNIEEKSDFAKTLTE